jgi:putative ABC transport system permease protein
MAKRALFYAQALDKIRALPGVEAAAYVMRIPLASWPADTTFKVTGRANEPVGGHEVDFDFCSADYFRAMGIPLLQGDYFDANDARNPRRLAIISGALARAHFPNENPIGKQITLEAFATTPDAPWEIVGVVGDVRRRGLDGDVRNGVYRPTAFDWDQDGHLVIRTKGVPMALAEAVRKAVLEVDSSQPVASVRPLQGIVEGSLAQHRIVLGLLGGFAAIALALAAIGLYGVIAYSVSQRTREIGIRMALGADRLNVINMILGHALKLVCVGLAFGIVASFASTRLLQGLLLAITATDLPTFTGVSGLLVCVAVAAAILPARRASNIEPNVALRNE